jgi:hypothetical protein
MWERRLRELLAIGLIGDGIFALIATRGQSRRWQLGPLPWQRLMTFFVERPNLTRALGVGEIAFGLWLGLRRAAS